MGTSSSSVAVANTAFGTANTVPTRAINLPIWGLGGEGSMPSCSRPRGATEQSIHDAFGLVARASTARWRMDL